MKDSSTKSKLPVLIVDRRGEIAKLLAQDLQGEFLPVVLSSKKPEGLSDEIVYIPLRKKIPKIPENYFPYIFFVDSQDYVRGLIKPLRKYAAKYSSVLNIITSIYYKRLPGFDEIARDRQTKLFVAGDMFDLDSGGHEVGKMLAMARGGRIVLPSQGLLEHFPVSSKEVSRVVLRSIPLGLGSRNLFLLHSPYPLTGLSVARSLSGSFPQAKIDIQNKKVKNGPLWLPVAGEFVETRSFPLQLKEVVEEGRGDDAIVYMSEKKIRPILPAIAAIGFFVVLFFILPLLSLLGFFAAGSFMTKLAVSELEAGDTLSAQKFAQNANSAFGLSDSIASSFLPAARTIGRGRSIESYSGKISALEKVNFIIVDISKGVEDFRVSQVETDSQKAKSSFIASQNRISSAFAALNSLQAEGKNPVSYQERLNSYQKLGEYYLSVKEILPEVLGYNGQRVYLVLFQNNNELRPGGGFIGSYGIMKVKNGNLEDLKVHDVYDADGQLTAHVEPPFPLKEHMGVKNWYLRDSNFAVDFPENGARAAYFLRLETGEEVDGVMAIDTTFIEDLLRKTGPVKIMDFNETIRHDNFSEILQSEIEDEFFPGSQKKKQLLTAVYDSLFEETKAGAGISLLGLGDTVLKSLSEKHILFAFADPKTQAPFTLANLSGSLWDGRQAKDGVINDFLGIVEANLGENKVNPFIERQISQVTALQEDGEMTSVVEISYKNTSKPEDRFGGDYENYLRFVYPFAANAISLKIDGVEKTMLPSVQGEAAQAERQRVSEEVLSVDLGEEKGKKILGLLVNVPTGGARKVEVVFQTQTEFTRLDPKLDYNLKLFKQPGRDADPYLFKFSFPQSYQVVSKSENVNATSDAASAFFLLNEDKEIEITLGKK